MKFLTVACNRDQSQLILQAESIDKFVKDPIEHYIIINEDDPDIISWYTKLKQYYTNHRLILLPRLSYDYSLIEKYISPVSDIPGWYTQQLQKLLFAYYIQDDYLILDSKDFFLRETDVSIFFRKQIIGNRLMLLSYCTEWTNTIKAYNDFFGTSLYTHFPGMVTPYKIDYKLITESQFFTKETLLETLFYPVINKKGNVSEFIFYSYLIPKDHAFWKTISLTDNNTNDTNINIILPKTTYIRKKTTDNVANVIARIIEVLSGNQYDMCSFNKSLFDAKNSNVDLVIIINHLLKRLSFNTQLTQYNLPT